MRMLIQFFRRLFGKPRSFAQAQADDRAALRAAARAADRRADAAAEESQIQDNSFLIEEAYNQDPGVVQHIQTFSRATRGGDWLYTFTQEWPAPNLKHQLSYTLPMAQHRR